MRAWGLGSEATNANEGNGDSGMSTSVSRESGVALVRLHLYGAEQAPAGAVTGPMSSLSQPDARGPHTAMPGARWRNYATKSAVTGVVLAGVVAGCSSQPAVPRGSVVSCYQFGVAAIRRHVTVTAVPGRLPGAEPA